MELLLTAIIVAGKDWVAELTGLDIVEEEEEQ